MRRLERGRRLLAVTAAAGALGAAAAAAAGEAEVVDRAGPVHAEAPDGTRRALDCGDLVRSGERIVVGADGRVGLLAGAVYAGLEADSAARWEAAGEGAPALALEVGRARVIDARPAGAERGSLRLATPHAVASGAGTDSEAYVLSEKAGSYSLVCEWEGALRVARGDEALTAEPGQCVVARAREPLYPTPAHEERVAMGPGGCSVGPVLGFAPERFDTTDVAAGPPPPRLLPPAPAAFQRSPCDTPGSGCSGGPGAGAPGIGVVESPAR